MSERSNQILSILSSRADKRIQVSELSTILNVSQVTARKDLTELVDAGIIIREHGYAILSDTNEVAARIALNYDVKKKIADKAAEFVSDGETIMIESGSCCALLADALVKRKKDITIITNSAFIADYIRQRTYFQIVLLGGIYQHEAQALVGPMVRECASNFFVKKFFIGAEGFSVDFGITGSDQMRGQAVKDMAKQAEKVIVLADHTKFDRQGVVPLNMNDKITHIITDSELSDEKTRKIERFNIEVVRV